MGDKTVPLADLKVNPKAWLRGFKQRIKPESDSARYQSRLKRELDRVDGVFASEDTPVLIQTYGKVGSTAIGVAISRLPGFAAFQTHFISGEGVRQAKRTHQEYDRDPIHLKVGDHLREKLAEYPGKPVKIITLVREPVSRAVSDLFENPGLLGNGASLDELGVENVIGLATSRIPYSMDYTEKWFDHELCDLFGIDVFAHGFDKEVGFSFVEAGRFQLLAGKLECLSASGGTSLGRFLGLDGDLPIEKHRARSATGEAFLYDQVREKLTLPVEILDKVYSSRICQHFYTDQEIAGFRAKWE